VLGASWSSCTKPRSPDPERVQITRPFADQAPAFESSHTSSVEALCDELVSKLSHQIVLIARFQSWCSFLQVHRIWLTNVRVSMGLHMYPLQPAALAFSSSPRMA